MNANHASILVISDVVSDAEVVLGLLKDHHPQALASTDPAKFAEDFERSRPQVLVLAFQTLEAAERCYLGLYRRSTVISTVPHRSLLLCEKNDVRRVYELCRESHFDDYVMFWPLVHDAPRLPMSVHLALRALDSQQAVASVAQFSAQGRRIAELEGLLERQLQLGLGHAMQAQQAVQQAQ